MSSAAEIEAVLFKPIGDRYVFQAPNPWVFGSKDRYLVDDAQKQELLAIVMPRRPMVRIAVISIGILLWTVAASMIVWAISPHADPSVVDAVAMFVLILVPIFFALIVALSAKSAPYASDPCQCAAHRGTDHAARTASGNDQSDLAAASTAPLGALWAVTCGFQVFILVIRNARHPLLSDVQSYLNLFTAIVAAGLVAYYLVLAIRKLRQTESAHFRSGDS